MIYADKLRVRSYLWESAKRGAFGVAVARALLSATRGDMTVEKGHVRFSSDNGHFVVERSLVNEMLRTVALSGEFGEAVSRIATPLYVGFLREDMSLVLLGPHDGDRKPAAKAFTKALRAALEDGKWSPVFKALIPRDANRSP